MKHLLSLLAAILFLTSCHSDNYEKPTTTEDPLLKIPYLVDEPLDEVVALFTDAGYIPFPFIYDGTLEAALSFSSTQMVLPIADEEDKVKSITSFCPAEYGYDAATFPEILKTYDAELFAEYGSAKSAIEFSFAIDGEWTEYEDMDAMIEAFEKADIEDITGALGYYTVGSAEPINVKVQYFKGASQLTGVMKSGYFTGISFERY